MQRWIFPLYPARGNHSQNTSWPLPPTPIGVYADELPCCDMDLFLSSRLFLSQQVSLQRPKQTPWPGLPSKSLWSRLSERTGLSHRPGTQQQGHGSSPGDTGPRPGPRASLVRTAWASLWKDTKCKGPASVRVEPWLCFHVRVWMQELCHSLCMRVCTRICRHGTDKSTARRLDGEKRHRAFFTHLPWPKARATRLLNRWRRREGRNKWLARWMKKGESQMEGRGMSVYPKSKARSC